MSFMGLLTGSKDSRKEYRCWMCGAKHVSPAAFLWHIKACDLEQKARVNRRASTTPLLFQMAQRLQ